MDGDRTQMVQALAMGGDAGMKTLKRSARWPECLAVTVAGVMFSSMLAAQAPAPVPLVKDNSTIKVSEHVYVIPDKNYTPLVPNIGIIVGSTLILGVILVSVGMAEHWLPRP